MMKAKTIVLFFLLTLFLFNFCTDKKGNDLSGDLFLPDSVVVEEKEEVFTIDSIKIEKDLSYDKYTLEDVYPYKDTTREFQWTKIKQRLFITDSIQRSPALWGILQNRKNINGEAPLVKNHKRNEYKRIADTLGVERWQSVPLYLPEDTLVPERYGRDGSLIKILDDGVNFIKINVVEFPGEWMVPKKYIHVIADTVVFTKTVFVDRLNQNIATIEKGDSSWLVRSMNPATTGVHRPPYAQETPTGIFVIQEKKSKMIFLKDGSNETGGFAPYASRFCNGGYLHGVPTNVPRTGMIEFSQTLGTIPRSHMCVRNATSHAKFIYDWAPIDGTLVFVFE